MQVLYLLMGEAGDCEIPMHRLLIILPLLVCFTVHADALLDAKRKAAADLLRDGKAADAVQLVEEVIKAGDGNFRDYLSLGRAYDRLNKPAEAVIGYRRVLALLPNPGSTEERAARAEADRRLKVLDIINNKVQMAAEEFFRKLDSLEREAIGARDVRAAEAVFRFKASTYQAAQRQDACGMEIFAAVAWQASPIKVLKGHRYRIRAAGTWNVGNTVCTADGVDRKNGESCGALMVTVNGQSPTLVKSSGVIEAPVDGNVFLIATATDAERKAASGSVFVLIEPVQ